MDLLCFCSVLCLLCLCARLFICALWSTAGKGLTSWLSFVVSAVSLSLSHWYPGIRTLRILKLELKTSKNESHKIQINHYGKQNSNSSMYSSFYEMNFIKVTVRSIIHKIRKKSTFNFYFLHL